MSDEKYKQEARHSWQEIASIAESVPESASYIHGFIDGMKIGNKELEHKLELEHSRIKNLENQNARMRECLCRIIEFENCENHFMTYTSSVAKKTLEELEGEE